MSERVVLALSAVISGIVSLVPFPFWQIYAIDTLDAYVSYLTGKAIAYSNFVRPLVSFSELAWTKELFDWAHILGGTYGWVSLAAAYCYMGRSIQSIPDWVKIGCAVGVICALSFGGQPSIFAIPPVAAVFLLFVLANIVD